MKAFLNDVKIHKKFIDRLQQHYKLDEIIKGQYWENGKGCAVGCTVHSSSHISYEIELGIPEWIAKLEDKLFEGMPNEKSKEFPLKLLKSIPIGFDNWQHIYHQLYVFMLEKICKNIDNKIVVKTICDVITLHKTESKDESAWSAARSAAYAAWSARSARSAARSAAYAAWSARSARSAGSAESAESAARSAESAESAESAARSAESAGSAGSAAYYDISEELIRLFKVNEKK